MWCASRRPPLGVRLFLSLFAISLRSTSPPVQDCAKFELLEAAGGVAFFCLLSV